MDIAEKSEKSWIKQIFLTVEIIRKNLFVKVYKRILKFARKCPEGFINVE